MNQGRIERFILDCIQEHSDLKVERGVIAESLKYDEKMENDPDAYPITVNIRTRGEEDLITLCCQGESTSGITRDELKRHDLRPDDWNHQEQSPRKSKIEIVKAKYLIGCDGAHSWTRKQLNIPVEGSNTDHIWSVFRTVPLSTSSSDVLYTGA